MWCKKTGGKKSQIGVIDELIGVFFLGFLWLVARRKKGARKKTRYPKPSKNLMQEKNVQRACPQVAKGLRMFFSRTTNTVCVVFSTVQAHFM